MILPEDFTILPVIGKQELKNPPHIGRIGAFLLHVLGQGSRGKLGAFLLYILGRGSREMDILSAPKLLLN